MPITSTLLSLDKWKKQVVMAELYTALVDKGILLQLQSTPKCPDRSSLVRLNELEVELQRLAFKEKKLQ